MRAISIFSFEAGTSSFCWRALTALRIRVNKSATGSVKLILISSYRLALVPSWETRPKRTAEVFNSQLSVFSNCTLETEYFFSYQDDLETPGISPRRASPRKHRRQTPNLRRYARGRPQSLQRLCLRVENLGFGPLLPRACSNFFSIFASLTLFAVVMQSLKNR